MFTSRSAGPYSASAFAIAATKVAASVTSTFSHSVLGRFSASKRSTRRATNSNG
ncbi:Uncharacterised protein [Vibrio cholerae]|nr:Uncharacterised protein [Vibrio cholerae]